MNTKLTIHVDDQLHEALQLRATALGKPVSEVAREILRAALAERPMAHRVGHLKGQLELSEPPAEGWRRELRAHNWTSAA